MTARPAGVGVTWTGSMASRTQTWVIRIVTLVLVLAAWEYLAADVNRIFSAPPSEVAVAIYQMAWQTPEIWLALAESLGTLAIGLVITIPVGIAVGIAMGRFRTFEFALDPYVTFLYVLPGVALIPLLVLWFGFDLQLRVVLVFLSAVFPLIVNTMAGVKSVDPELLDGARSFCATERQTLRTVVLPASLPFIFAGLRIAFSSAWVGVIVAEMTALLAGIGGMITIYANLFQTSRLFVPIFFIMLVGVVVNALLVLLYRALRPWQRA